MILPVANGMQNHPVRIALIGVGGVTAFHHLPGVQNTPGAELTWLCDVNEELLAQRSMEWNCPQTSGDFSEVVTANDVDAVVIATANQTHVEIATAALEAGKHVMCEKPLGLQSEEVKGLVERAEAQPDLVNMTAFTYRFSPAMRQLMRLKESGELGTVNFFSAERMANLGTTSLGWRQLKSLAGSGSTGDFLVHRLDYGTALCGAVVKVFGAVKQVYRRDDQGEPSEVEDISAATVLFENGAVGNLQTSWSAQGFQNGASFERALLLGEKASAAYELNRPYDYQFGDAEREMAWQPVEDELEVGPGSEREIRIHPDGHEFRWDLVSAFVRQIQNGDYAGLPTFRDGYHAQLVTDAILESAETGQAIEVNY